MFLAFGAVDWELDTDDLPRLSDDAIHRINLDRWEDAPATTAPPSVYPKDLPRPACTGSYGGFVWSSSAAFREEDVWHGKAA